MICISFLCYSKIHLFKYAFVICNLSSLQAMGVAGMRSVHVNSRMEADFNFMYLTKPAKMKIRRIFNTGVWAQFRCSSHSVQFHLKVCVMNAVFSWFSNKKFCEVSNIIVPCELQVENLQIDNQQKGCVFPVAFAPGIIFQLPDIFQFPFSSSMLVSFERLNNAYLIDPDSPFLQFRHPWAWKPAKEHDPLLKFPWLFGSQTFPISNTLNCARYAFYVGWVRFWFHYTSNMWDSGVSICKTLIPENITLGHHGVTHFNTFTIFLFSNFCHLPFF